MTATVYFEIREIRTDRLREYERVNKEALDRDDWSYHSSFFDGAEAAREVERLKERHPEYSFCIIKRDPAAGDKNWRTREITRLMDGTYKLVPGILPIDKPEHIVSMSADDYARHYGGRTFHDLLMQAQPSHFVHLSQSDERKLAFTESDLKGEKDKQRTISPMSYITRHIPHAWPDQIQDLFIEAMGGLDIQLQFAKTREEFVEIYTECDSSREVGSCMSHPTENYESHPVHPVEVYAAGDLQLCYVRENGDTGKIWGRCLVWPEKKTWGRIYSTNASLMRKALKAAGYESGENTDSLIGAKLNLIWDDEDQNRIVMPYIDHTFRAQYDHESGMLTIAGRDGNIEAEQTNGLAYIDSANRYCCDRCGDSVHEDDSYYLGGSDATWCRDCYENHAFHCDGCHESYNMSSTGYSVSDDGYTYCDECYSERYAHCDDCHSETPIDEISWHENSSRDLCNDCYAERTEEDAEDGEAEAPAINAAVDALRNHVTGAIERGEAEAIVEIVTQWDGKTAPQGFCFYLPTVALQAPPYWRSGMLSDMVQRGDYSAINLVPRYWVFTDTDANLWRYVVPIEAITGQPSANLQTTATAEEEELAAA